MRDEFELENKILHLEYKLAAANEKIARVEAVLLERDPGQYVTTKWRGLCVGILERIVFRHHVG